ncbi:MAG: HlyD family efflux transporter periplasmic adaptor subunit [Anaerolineales bacterium]|nr:HlyD family efflux transporter periplasmic adaptor subunit [Anaerolineales bacterium]
MISRPKLLLYSFLIPLTVFLLSACASPDRRTGPAVDEPTPIPTPVAAAKTTYTVARGDVVYEQTISGRVVPLVEAPLNFPIDGIVKEVFFEREDTVQAGEIIAILDTTPLEEELLMAQAQLAIAQSRLTTTQTQVEIDRRRAELAVTLAQLDLDFAISQAGGFPTPQQQYQLDRLTVLLELAQLDFQELNDTIDPALQADVDQAALRVAELEQVIASAVLVAPFDGRIFSLRITPGRAVVASEAVGSLADLSEYEISANISSTQLQGMQEEMPVTISLSSRPGEAFTGYLRQLPYPFGSGSRDAEDDATRIAFDSPEIATAFAVGDRVTITILIAKQVNVLWLPPAAIREFNGRMFVVIQDDQGNQRRVDITLGIEGGERVEIVEGVLEGEVVVGP